ncbi:MAG: hypothetical protein ACJ72H_32805 [Candidatus Sulfotelmatobacter sp.]
MTVIASESTAFASEAFEAGENAAVVALVALHGEAALLVAILPGEADEVLLGFGECHEPSDTEAHHSETDSSSDTTMNVLPIGNFGDCGGWDDFDFIATLAEVNVLLTKRQYQLGAGFDVWE